MKIVNLTPHAINICSEDGAVTRTIPASGEQARCAVTQTADGDFDGIPHHRLQEFQCESVMVCLLCQAQY